MTDLRKNDYIIEARNLKTHFQMKRSGHLARKSAVHAVDGVSFGVRKGTTFGLVGESGSGKTTAALALMRLGPITSGRVLLAGRDITRVEGNALKDLRRRIQIIFQDPYSSLNPRQRAGAIVRDPLDLMRAGGIAEREKMVEELFRDVGLRPEQKAFFPHQFSGGQRQRIGIARALAPGPELIVCDEPVSALDVAIQAQILNLLRRLQAERGFSYLFISHDLGVVQYMCDEIAVMYMGLIVEQADRVSLFSNPRHPYTQALFSAVPSARPGRVKNRRIRLRGDPASPVDPPPGCRFASRCPHAISRCSARTPALVEVAPGHLASCHLLAP